MAFIDNVLQKPSYGWANERGELIVPSTRQLYREAFSRINIFKTKKNWITLMSWLMVLCMTPFAYFFITQYITWWLLPIMLFYTLIAMGTHGTIWFHRYCTHHAYQFSHPFWRFITQNLVIKVIPEEMYIVSHHVHHVKSDQPGDPYNSRAGFWYCMLADVNHQSIAKDLSEPDYKKVTRFLRHTGIKANSYKQYRKWGSITRPFSAIAGMLLNWAFWFAALYLIGGFGLACALFTAAMFWVVFVRAFNYTGHGNGKVKHVDGIDFDRSNLAINQSRPGYFTGEWHNNHHLYPASARSGFLPNQLDLAWIYIYCLYKLGAVASYHDSKGEFLKKYFSKKPEEVK
ncbi:MAG TPA: fatty acid desaturase [Chitinophagaceae bacterium]|nr:fatty acid desaturase [Chitinophagaceae bacterium]